MNFAKRMACCIAGLGFVLPALGKEEISGAGASFPSVIYSSWGFTYAKEKGVTVKYNPSGSGEGIRSIEARKVDFGASDSPLAESELAKRGLVQFPTVLGGVVPVVNLPGVSDNQVKLSGAVLAEIFAGKITNWNDPKIAALSSGARLPNLKISRVVREEKSGTTEAFVTFLAASSKAWTGGVGQTVTWPSDVIPAKGNDGVVKAVSSTPGSIGYISMDRLGKGSFAAVALKNKKGSIVSANEASVAAAAKLPELRKNVYASLIDTAVQDAWPIVTMTFILVESQPKTAQQASRTLQFFYWAMLRGDDAVRGTGFAPLPSEVQARVIKKLAEVTAQDGKPVQIMQDRGSQGLQVAGLSNSR